jgi:hypothetical protein
MSLRYILIPSSHLRHGLPSGHSLSRFPIKTLYNLLSSPMPRGATALTNLGPAQQPPLAVFPDCTRRYWVDMWSAHRIPQLHFQLSSLLLYSSNYSVYPITSVKMMQGKKNSHYRHACAKGKSIAPTHS